MSSARPTLILLPGMMCDGRLFAPQAAAFPDHDVVTPGLDRHDSVEALADDILSAAPGRFALAGLSMGGIVAMEIVARAPDRVSHLALLDTNHRAETPERAAGRGPQIEAVRQGGLRAVMRDEMKPNYLADGPRKAAILDLCMEMAEDLGPEVFARQSKALTTRPDQTETLRCLTMPTLVLCGAEDRLCPPSRHQEMAALIPSATLRILNGAGHLPVLERPEATNAALAEWLAQ